jgi:probable addiction module antidote protein
MTKPYRSHDEATAEMLRNDPAFAAVYLDYIIEVGDQADLLVALRHIVNAFGVQQVAADADLNPKTLYRTLSAEGNPELRSLTRMLAAVGLRLSVQPIVKKPRRTRSPRSPSATAR